MAWLLDDLGNPWAKRIKITIDHTKIDTDLSYFPIMIPITDPKVFAEVGANWQHIAITEADGETECYVEVELWDHENQAAYIYALVPSISSSVDTEIYLYYDVLISNTYYVGNHQANYTFNAFSLVQHLQETYYDLIPDSSPNFNMGTPANTPSFVDGQVGNALEFNGSNDGIDLDGLYTLTEFTIQILGKITDYTANRDICGNSTHHLNGRLFISSVPATIGWRSSSYISLTSPLPTDTYFLLTITRDASNNWKVYLNDADVTSGSPAFTEEFKLDRIGLCPDSVSSTGWKGLMDEFRVLDYALSPEEIKADYNSFFNTLVSFGSEEVSVITVPLATLSIRSLHPVIIPFYVSPPTGILRLKSLNPYWQWAIQQSTLLKQVIEFEIGGAYIGQSDIKIPISSCVITKTRVSARQFPSVEYETWAAYTEYYSGDVIKPTVANGYRYKCIKSGRSYSSRIPNYPSWAKSLYHAGDRIMSGDGDVYEFVQCDTPDKGLSGSGRPFNGAQFSALDHKGDTIQVWVLHFISYPFHSPPSISENEAAEPSWGGATVTESGYSHTGTAIINGWAVHAAWPGTLTWQKITPGEPNWPLQYGATVNDGTCVWQNIGQDEVWDEETAYTINEITYPSVDNGFNYKCTKAGTSGTVAPVWPTTLNESVVDGSVTWKCYKRVPITTLTEISVSIPGGSAWADIVAARSGGMMRIYTGAVYLINGATVKKLELISEVTITNISRQIDSKSDFITIKGSLQGKENYLAGEINWPLTKYGNYAQSDGKVSIEYPYIYDNIRPGDIIILPTGSFEIGKITLTTTSKTKTMKIEEF